MVPYKRKCRFKDQGTHHLHTATVTSRCRPRSGLPLSLSASATPDARWYVTNAAPLGRPVAKSRMREIGLASAPHGSNSRVASSSSQSRGRYLTNTCSAGRLFGRFRCWPLQVHEGSTMENESPLNHAPLNQAMWHLHTLNQPTWRLHN